MAKAPPTLKHLPARANPLAKRIGRLMRLYRNARKWSVDQAAQSLGINRFHYMALEGGKIVPSPNTAARLWGWLAEKKTYEGAPPLSTRQFMPEDSDKWRVVKVALPKEKANRLTKMAKRLGMSNSALGAVFIELGLESRMAFVTLEEAVKTVEEAWAVDALAHNPELRDLLLMDRAMIEATPELVPFTVAEKLRPEVEKVAELKLDLSEWENDVEEI